MSKKEILMSSNRNFGLVFSIFFLIISLWPLLNSNEIRLWSLILSLIFLILGILNSKLLAPLNKLWMKFGLFLGAIVSPIIMGIIYFFVVTPTGLIMKILGKDLLLLKRNNKQSYWIEKENVKSSMKNQF
tara:strand:+ start:104 stop:493 length:390 start_codon:yes stop_codon:yes gene_type:complete